jgi:hypothetical protein
VTDAAVLSSFVDGTLLVIDAKRSHRKFVALARESLAHAGGHTLGAVLNRVEGSADLAYDGYYGLGSHTDTGRTDDSSGSRDQVAPDLQRPTL